MNVLETRHFKRADIFNKLSTQTYSSTLYEIKHALTIGISFEQDQWLFNIGMRVNHAISR